MEQYLVPKNVRSKFEFFPGLGWKEIFITLIGLLSGGIICVFLRFFTQHAMSFLPIVVGTAIAFFISKPDARTGLSFLQTLSSFKDFKTKQSKYYYRFGEGRKNA